MSLFYDTKKLNLKEKMDLLKEAKPLSFEWEVHQLQGFKRVKIELPFEEVLSFLTEECHFYCIDRREGFKLDSRKYSTIGFCTIGSQNDLFLFLYIDQDVSSDIIEKYKLKPILR